LINGGGHTRDLLRGRPFCYLMTHQASIAIKFVDR
jgi:hypothetical protein